jgi:hypothetical protein
MCTWSHWWLLVCPHARSCARCRVGSGGQSRFSLKGH